MKSDRGKVVTLPLKPPIWLNGNKITKALVELDHINHGLDPATGGLKKKRRSAFTARNIEAFLRLLDGEDVPARRYKKLISEFDVRIDCPVKGRFYMKQFFLFFNTNYSKPDEIHVITLYPGWKK